MTTNRPGTPAYMAPEQVARKADQPVGPAADVFAFGLTMAFAASGESPYGEGTGEVLFFRVLNEEPDLSGVDDPDLRALIEECVRKDPARRPTAAQLIERCAPHLAPREKLDWLPVPVVAGIGKHPTVTVPPRPRRHVLAIAIVALVLSLASVALQVFRWTPAPAAPPAGAATVSPSASPAVTPPPVSVASATPGPAVPVVPAPTTRRVAPPPPPPPATQGPPCIVGLWTLMSSQEYISIDTTPPDELRYTAGTKQISYGVGGSGTVSYQDHSRFATASDDGSEWHYLTITEFASFDYGVSSGRITHTLKSKSGQLRIFHNGVQQFDGPPGDPFYAGAQTMTCTATTLRVTAPAFVETYRRS